MEFTFTSRWNTDSILVCLLVFRVSVVIGLSGIIGLPPLISDYNIRGGLYLLW